VSVLIKAHQSKGFILMHRSFTLLEIWNKYFTSVPAEVFNKQIISMGDVLFERQVCISLQDFSHLIIVVGICSS